MFKLSDEQILEARRKYSKLVETPHVDRCYEDILGEMNTSHTAYAIVDWLQGLIDSYEIISSNASMVSGISYAKTALEQALKAEGIERLEVRE